MEAVKFMAGTSKKKKKKHGKIEKKKSAPFLQFKLGVLLLLIVLSFAMKSAKRRHQGHQLPPT